MYERHYLCTLSGISPLIMHWDNIEWADQIAARRTQIKKDDKANFAAGDDRCPPETWKGCIYNDGERIVMPTDNLRACLLRAAARKELSGKKTYKELSQCAVLFDDVYAAMFFGPEQQQIAWPDVEAVSGAFPDQLTAARGLGFDLLIKRARVDRKKHVRVRPIFASWVVIAGITVVDQQVTADVLNEIWGIAGVNIGLCDWRPGEKESPGPYGRYVAELKAA